MFKALGRLFRAIGHKLGGFFGRKTENLMKDADTMKGAYQDVIDEKKNRMQQYMTAVGEMSAQNERRLSNIARLNEEVVRLEKVMGGALARAKQHQSKLVSDGKTPDEISHDEMMIRLKGAYADAKSTCDSKKEQIAGLEEEIRENKKRIGSHEVQLHTMQREIQRLKSEKSEAVADVKAAEFEESIANTLSGISEDKTDETLEMLRGIRDNAKGKAAVARSVAGNDAAAFDNELASFGADSVGANEFDALLSGDMTETVDIDQPAEVEMDLGGSKTGS